MVEIDPKKSFCGNYKSGCSKEELMKYYCIKTEQEYDKLIQSHEKRRTPEKANVFGKKTKVREENK